MGNGSILALGEFTYYAVTEHGMTFSPDTPRNFWLESLKKLCQMHEGAIMTAERTLMLMADALNFGEDKFGEEFAQAIDGTRQALGLTPKTVANAKWAYKNIDASRRRDGLTLGHYCLIAALPAEAQETLMDEALKANLSVADLKTEVAERFPKTKRGKDRKTKAKQSSVNETPATALQKVIDVSNWISANPNAALSLIDAKWKSPLEKLYKIYRRKWQTGRKR